MAFGQTALHHTNFLKNFVISTVVVKLTRFKWLQNHPGKYDSSTYQTFSELREICGRLENWWNSAGRVCQLEYWGPHRSLESQSVCDRNTSYHRVPVLTNLQVIYIRQ